MPSEFNDFLPKDCDEYKRWKASQEAGVSGAMAGLTVASGEGGAAVGAAAAAPAQEKKQSSKKKKSKPEVGDMMWQQRSGGAEAGAKPPCCVVGCLRDRRAAGDTHTPCRSC